MTDRSEIDEGRRGFLKLAGLAPAVAVAAGAGLPAEAAEAAPEAAGLRQTAHVKKYFETARF